MRSLAFSFALLACGGPNVDAPDAGTQDVSAPSAFSDQVSLSELASFQTVKVDVMKDGADISKLNAPIVTDRATLLRAYLTVAKGWKATLVDAELDVTAQGRTFVFTDAKTIHRSSSDDDLTTTFDFSLPDSLVNPSTTFSLTVWRDDTGEELRYPASGGARALPASNGGVVHVTMVPIQYDADDSHRLPNLNDVQLARFHDTLYKMYPTRLVEVAVHDPMLWNQAIDPMGAGWDEVLTAVADLRAREAPPDNAYYVAAFEPAPTISKFCDQGGCILGIAPLAGPDDVDLRVAAVLGYGGEQAPNTLLQELGHAMGREHADCGGADAPDPKFPYPGAGIGAAGYDIVAQTLVDPNANFDFMGYCSPVWISDYTYGALFNRIAHVSKNVDESPWMAPTQPQKMSMRVVHVGPDGTTRLGRALRITPPRGATRTVSLATRSGGARRLDVPFVALDRGRGGLLFVPAAQLADTVGSPALVR